MNYLMYHPRSRPSGQALAAALRARAGTGRSGLPPGTDCLIRWGSQRHPQLDEGQQVLNSPRALARAADKLKAFQKMQEAGLSIPVFAETPVGLNLWPLIGRTRRGRGGEGIVLYQEGEIVGEPRVVCAVH